jgi:hypothetical protein
MEKVKAVLVLHSDARWNGKTETCIKIEDSFLGGYFSHETKSLLIHKTMQMMPQADINSY